VVLGVIALPAWVFFTLVVDVPAISVFLAPACIPLLFAFILVAVSPRMAIATFLISFGLATFVGAVALNLAVAWR
jgi:hypothetical protein